MIKRWFGGAFDPKRWLWLGCLGRRLVFTLAAELCGKCFLRSKEGVSVPVTEHKDGLARISCTAYRTL